MPGPRVNQYGDRGAGRAVLTAFGLGAGFGLGIALALLSSSFIDFGLYLVALAVFHLWEYNYVALYRPAELWWGSFMLNHSTEFNIAMGASFVEYFLESFFFPGLKNNMIIVIPAFIVVLIGQAIRTISMSTAGQNFNHTIEETKEDDHKLVDHGIYSIFRHPSYFGWFWWAIFTQVMLENPLCIVLFTVASWTFFNERIHYEEVTLIDMFGEEYIKYAKKTPTWIPLIK
eukprot:TRINITY_DN790_c0_g1_i9.p1 TRINITY_DN790_c0_g1~~TRINITY_DN790_c0_g1_i9.p1  ORF type:complete len:264 (-),score=39.34 TRINITY_DN790_c0_g1_i9:187-876(-)